MNGWTLAWLFFAAAVAIVFFLIEIPAVRRPGGRDTLTDHITWAFALKPGDRPRFWIVRRIAFLYLAAGTPVVLIAHFMGWF